MRVISFKIIGNAACALLFSFSSVLSAQPVPASSCKAFLSTVFDDGPEMLQVVCGNAGTVLGQVDDYELVELPDEQAAVVTTSYEGSKRVWLVMQSGDNSLALEEITGTIARAAGVEASTNLDGVDLDFAKGATEPLNIGIASPGNLIGTVSSDGVDLSQLVDRARAVRASEPLSDEE